MASLDFYIAKLASSWNFKPKLNGLTEYNNKKFSLNNFHESFFQPVASWSVSQIYTKNIPASYLTAGER